MFNRRRIMEPGCLNGEIFHMQQKLVIAMATFALASSAWSQPQPPGATNGTCDAVNAQPATSGAALARGRRAVEAKQYVEALCWFRMSSSQGNARAQRNIGAMYLTLSQNYPVAMQWFSLAARNGDTAAQVDIGNMYDRGQGVARDHTEALRWYRMATAKGDASAQKIMASMKTMETKPQTGPQVSVGEALFGMLVLGLAADALMGGSPSSGVDDEYNRSLSRSRELTEIERSNQENAERQARAELDRQSRESAMGCAWGNRTDGTCQ
jgi:TPR repeat protein